MPEYDNTARLSSTLRLRPEGSSSKSNRGVLFRNPKKQAGDNRPDYTGRINVNGVDAFISGWVKESRAGDKFLSIAVQTEDQRKGGAGGQRGNGQRPAKPAAPVEPAQEQPADDDIPF